MQLVEPFREEGIISLPAETAKWYAIYTRCHHEFTIWNHLEKKAIENFFPCVTRWSRRKDRKLKIQVPLFPGYLFVRMDFHPHRALQVLKIKGVVRFLGESAQNPAPIPDIQIESLQKIISSGDEVFAFPYLRVGQRVHVERGLFEGCEGILCRIKSGKDRLVISLELLKQSVSVEIDASDVVPI